MKIKLGVIFGGISVEHEVSVISAVQAMENLNKDKYDIIPIYISKEGTWYTGKMLEDINIYKDFEDLKKYAKKVVFYNKNGSFVLQTTGLFKRIINEVDIVFPIVHGNNVEDGTIQGYLQTVGVPYVGSGILGSSIGQDKVIMKQIMNNNNIPIAEYTWFYESEYFKDRENVLNKIKKMGYPVIVKPSTLGSSIGISVAKDDKKIADCINEALKYDHKIVVEKVIDNLIELNCSVLGNHTNSEASLIEQVLTDDDYLTFTDKYVGKGKGKCCTKGMEATSRIIPANVSEKIIKEVNELAIKTFNCLNFSGVARIDFLLDSKKNKVYVNEPNTIPGSLSFYLWAPKGKKYSELLDDMINIAIKDYKNKEKRITSFENNILSNVNGLKGGKKFN